MVTIRCDLCSKVINKDGIDLTIGSEEEEDYDICFKCIKRLKDFIEKLPFEDGKTVDVYLEKDVLEKEKETKQ